MMIRSLIPAAFLLLSQIGQTQTVRKPVFISSDQLDIASILPSPPAADSQCVKEEIAELHRIQDSRTAAEIDHARKDDKEESIFLFTDVMGEKFTRAALPMTAVLSDHLHNDEGVIVNPAKNFFKRPRPYHFDTTIKPVCKTTENLADYSYPSGHGTTGYLEAFVLAMLVPEKRDAILARAEDYGHSRLVCGVHYATDEAASRTVAYAMIGVMMNNPQFRKEFEAAKAEIRSAFGM